MLLTHLLSLLETRSSLLISLLSRSGSLLLTFELALLSHLLTSLLLLSLLLRSSRRRSRLSGLRRGLLFTHEQAHLASRGLVALLRSARKLSHALRADQRLRQAVRPPYHRRLRSLFHFQLVALSS